MTKLWFHICNKWWMFNILISKSFINCHLQPSHILDFMSCMRRWLCCQTKTLWVTRWFREKHRDLAAPSRYSKSRFPLCLQVRIQKIYTGCSTNQICEESADIRWMMISSQQADYFVTSSIDQGSMALFGRSITLYSFQALSITLFKRITIIHFHKSLQSE